MLVAPSKAGADRKVPGQIKAFFDYIGRGTKSDAAAKRAGYKGSSALNGAKDASSTTTRRTPSRSSRGIAATSCSTGASTAGTP